MIPQRPIELEGKDLENFERYQKRTASREELDYAEKADEVFKQNPPKHK
jgi:hypothetical protein